MSNLFKQQYVINLGNETRIINGDERFKQLEIAQVVPINPDMEEGFVEGLDAEPVFVEPEITPEEILEQARKEAEGLLIVARLEAEKMTDEAKKQAELLFEQKKQQGYQEGVSKLQDEVLEHKEKLQNEYDQLKLALDQERESLQAEYEGKLDTLEADLVEVMIQVFHKVFHVQFDNKKQILLHLIKDTLLGIDAVKYFVIRVADSNYKFIESHVAEIKEKVGNDVTIDVINDRTLDENDCMIETPTGVFNCGIDMVLSNLEKDIKSLCR